MTQSETLGRLRFIHFSQGEWMELKQHSQATGPLHASSEGE